MVLRLVSSLGCSGRTWGCGAAALLAPRGTPRAGEADRLTRSQARPAQPRDPARAPRGGTSLKRTPAAPADKLLSPLTPARCPSEQHLYRIVQCRGRPPLLKLGGGGRGGGTLFFLHLFFHPAQTLEEPNPSGEASARTPAGWLGRHGTSGAHGPRSGATQPCCGRGSRGHAPRTGRRGRAPRQPHPAPGQHPDARCCHVRLIGASGFPVATGSAFCPSALARGRAGGCPGLHGTA